MVKPCALSFNNIFNIFEDPNKIAVLNRVTSEDWDTAGAVRSTQRWLLVVKEEGLVDPLRRAPVRFIARLIRDRVSSFFLSFGAVWI